MKAMKWFYAKANLACALLIHLLFKRWFKKRGIEQFLKDYVTEGIFPLKVEERKNFSSFGRCIQCGFCITACKIQDPIFFQKFISPSQIAFSYSRSLPEMRGNGDFLAHCRECRACEEVCPTGVPLTQMMEFVGHHVS